MRLRVKHNLFLILLVTCLSFSKKDERINLSKEKFYSVNEIVSVRIYTQLKVNSFLFSPTEGNYCLIGDGKTLLKANNKEVIKLILTANDSIEVHMQESKIGRYKRIKLNTEEIEKGFKLKLLTPDKKPRFYEGNLSVFVDDKRLGLINHTKLDHYIAGVSEAEAGKRSTIEFYKVQAILARTYALGHLHKHAAEGFNLCDQVHCQVFFGKTNDANILEAVKLTHGQVVVDKDLQLITAAFHSNSGGQTANSEDVWGTNTSYLKSICDSFSLKMPNAHWERKIALDDWLSYLKIRYNYPVDDSMAKAYALHFRQDNRKVNLEYGNVKVPLKNVRTDFQLKSTFFSIDPKGDSLIFIGRGFGHGIGMCQEGAMCMTKCGYNYKQVLNFYYRNVLLLDVKEMAFFKED